MEPIAIIGMGCRFPGAKNPEALWQLLRNGVDAVSEVPADRWDLDTLYDPNPGSRGKMNTRWGGFLEQIDQFNPQFFGITPREAVHMDPQQRLLLEVAWEALEDAGLVAEQLARTNVGVFIGISSSDYRLQMQLQYLGEYSKINAYMGTGNAFSIAANRLSYLFDFRGPSIAIDTACSSSLVALHLACQSLRSGESNLALAGGVNLLLSPELTIIFSQAQMMAPDGRCRAFDAKANGYVRGEGCGIVVLKRLSDALRDSDNILALIRGSAINQDGRSNGLTAPNGPAQEAVIRQALVNAAVAPAQISYVEAHGTGTSLGDPIEAEALGAVLSEGRSGNRCILGSIKTNIGHLEAAAGIASIIKVALSLHHREIPPSLHFQQPNPYILFDKLSLQVQQALGPWPDTASPALAGVSSFGFGGANAHVILEEAAPAAPAAPTAPAAPAHLLPLSASSPEALRSLTRAYQEFLAPAASGFTVSLQDICYTASVRRSHHNHRLALVFRNREELTERLEAFGQGEARSGLFCDRKQHRRPKLVFVFSGQGPQWWAMGRELWQQEPVFRATLKQCDTLLRSYARWSLIEELMADQPQSRLTETEIAQPAIFALQVALAALWQSWGVKPSAVVGHSVGEVAAAHVAGALSLEDAVRVVFHRGRLMQQATGLGKMAAVELSLAQAEQLLVNYEGRLAIAAINSPTSVVLSGEATALEELLQSLQQQQIFCRLLQVNYAFHSPQVEPFQAELLQALQGLEPQATSVPTISTVTGTVHHGQKFDAAYWGRNIREPVRFAAAIEHLVQKKHNLFLELSPHPVLSTNISQCLRLSSGQEGSVLPSLRRQEGELAVMLGSLGVLYTLGHPIEWRQLYPSAGKLVSLPSYPWQRERYWLEAVDTQQLQQRFEAAIFQTKVAKLDGNLDTQQHQQRFEAVTAQTKVTKLDGNLDAKHSLTRAQLLAATSKDRQHLLESYLSQLFAKVMGFSATKVDLQQPLYSLGLDSLMALELRNQIEADLGIVIPLENFLVHNVAQFVMQVLLLVEEKAPAECPQATVAAALSQATLWVTRQKLNPQARLRLFCFPYAGVGASIFRAWSDDLPPEIEVCPIQLPGREDRLRESPFTRLSPLIQTLAPLLYPYLDIPFAFFGHSMGALLSFELIRELRRQNRPCPVHLFVSASRAPQIPDLDIPVHRLPEPKFIEYLHRLNGTPKEILQNPELMQLFVPTLRSDLVTLETYFYATEERLNCPISAFGGTQDSKVSPEQLAAWRDQTRSDFSLQMFPGDHFFLHNNRRQLLQAIAQKIHQLVLN